MHRFSAALFAIFFAFVITQNASAADMPTKAAPLTPAPARPLWTGFYVGGHIGGAWSRNGQSEGQGFDGPAPATPLLPFDTDDSGVIGGGQIGYNWSFAPSWVAGIEG